MGLANLELDLLGARPFGARQMQHEIVIVRTEPTPEKARRDRKVHDKSSTLSSSTPRNQLAKTSSPNSARSRVFTRTQASLGAVCSCCATVLLLLHCSRSRRYAPHAMHLSSRRWPTRTFISVPTDEPPIPSFEARGGPPPSNPKPSHGAYRHRAVLETAGDIVTGAVTQFGHRLGSCQAPATRTANEEELVVLLDTKRLELTRQALDEARIHGLIGKGLPLDKDRPLPNRSEIGKPDIGPFRTRPDIDQLRLWARD